MNEKELVIEIAKANVEAVYTDAAKPSVRIIGRSLAQAVSLFVSPLGRMAEIGEKNIHRYLDKLDGVAEKDLVAPDTRILIPVLEKMRYIDDEKVADYYAEILASASNKTTKDQILVSFIEILNRLSSDEIKILEYVGSTQNFVKVSSKEESKNIPLQGSLPIIDIRSISEGDGGYLTPHRNFNLLFENIDDFNFKNFNLYVDNMISLGLIEKLPNFTYSNKEIYNEVENHKITLELMEKINNTKGKKAELSQGRLDLTQLGKHLLSVCVK